MTSPRILVAALACALVAGAIEASPSPADTQTTATMTVPMHELNGSGENGTAILTAVGDKVTVSVTLTGEPKGASQPAHVHLGRCPNIKAVPAYNVGPIVDGKAASAVELTWPEIVSGKYAVNVHESATTLGKYVSCGNIGNSATPLPLPTDNSGY